MRHFKEQSKCIICENNSVHPMRYVEMIDTGWLWWRIYVGRHLRRTCQRCGYQWCEELPIVQQSRERKCRMERRSP